MDFDPLTLNSKISFNPAPFPKAMTKKRKFCSFDLLWNQSQQQFGIPFSSIISMFCNLVPSDSLNFCSPDHDYYNLLLPSFAILIQHMERAKSQNTIIFSVCY